MKNINKTKKHWAVPQKKRAASKIKISQGILFKFLLLVFIGVAVYSFLFSGFLKVSEINVSGAETIGKEKIENGFREMVEGKYLGLFEKNNILFIYKKTVDRQMKDKFKKIEEIGFRKEFPDKIYLDIKERKTTLLLCSQGNCFFVDKNGYAYGKADLNSEEVLQNKLIKLINESEKQFSEGERVLMPDFVSFIFGVEDEIKNVSNIDITGEYRSKSLIAEEIIIQTDKGWDIYLSSTFPINKSARMLKTVLDKQISLQETNNLEYIDLRSENKVFYRMKEDGAKEEKVPEEESGEKKTENNSEDQE